jgi:adenosylcobinamide kinase/adenosylcobinamide-phosphate guanylyltransferase
MLTLVLGGARSGKSSHALRLTEATRPLRLFVATAQAFDDEMADRIARHRAERHEGWDTMEAPLLEGLDTLIGGEAAVLVDCLTLWLSNVMLSGGDADRATGRMLADVARIGAPVVMVSNEVGMGLVPETPLGRAFRDAQGRLNQRVAAAADRVDFVAAGLPIRLKG